MASSSHSVSPAGNTPLIYFKKIDDTHYEAHALYTSNKGERLNFNLGTVSTVSRISSFFGKLFGHSVDITHNIHSSRGAASQPTQETYISKEAFEALQATAAQRILDTLSATHESLSKRETLVTQIGQLPKIGIDPWEVDPKEKNFKAALKLLVESDPKWAEIIEKQNGMHILTEFINAVGYPNLVIPEFSIDDSDYVLEPIKKHIRALLQEVLVDQQDAGVGMQSKLEILNTMKSLEFENLPFELEHYIPKWLGKDRRGR